MAYTKLTLPQKWVLPIVLVFLLLSLFLIEYAILSYSKGEFIYLYDEAYIRMATAKNIALHGVWGVSPSEFNSVSSSILFPLVLALFYKIFGMHLIIPFLINLVVAIWCIWVIQSWLQKQGVRPGPQLLVLLSIFILTPFPILIISGMEHVFQILFMFLFLFNAGKWLSEERVQSYKRLPLTIYILGALLVATRYEGIFIILLFSLLLLCRRRWIIGAFFVIVCLSPIIILGIFSIDRDFFFFPTSIMAKAFPAPLNSEAITKFFREEIIKRIFYSYATSGTVAVERILLVIPIALIMTKYKNPISSFYTIFMSVILGACILHICFASSALFFRYESYLIAAAVFILGVLLARGGLLTKNIIGFKWVRIWLFIILFYPFLSRAWYAYTDAIPTSLNAYEQSYQAGKFVQRFYSDSTVIIDDAGAASYFSDGKKIDLNTGILYTEITRAREGDYFRGPYLNYLIRKENPSIAIIIEGRYNYEILQKWRKVADWYTNNRIVFKGDHISLYAIDSSFVDILRQQVKNFEPTLPAGVKVVYQ